MSVTVLFDLETGGLLDSHPDIQLAAIAVQDSDLSEVACYQAKIQFDESKADPEALKLNHYDPAIWASEAKPLSQVLTEFASFLSKYRCVEFISKRTMRPYTVARLAGHNAASFDFPRLQRSFKAEGLFLPADPRVLDTCQLAMWHFHGRAEAPKDYKLATLAEWFKIEATGAHDALVDVRLCIALAKAIREGK